MAIRLTKPWVPIAEALTALHGHLGVFQLSNAEHDVIYMGFAGGKSQFGLEGEVTAVAERIPGATHVRVEITTAYQTRFRELMMVHVADFGEPPALNPPIKLGKMSPA